MAQTFTVTIVKENDEEFEFYLKMGDNNRQVFETFKKSVKVSTYRSFFLNYFLFIY